jgi:hypothetical protein
MEEITFSKNQKGKDTVLVGLHRYNRNGSNINGTTLWRCVNRDECAASITINSEGTRVIRESTHLCEASTSKNAIHLAKQDFKSNVCTRYSPVRKIYEECFSALHEADDDSDSDSNTTHVPTFDSLKRSMYRARNNVLNVTSTKFNNLSDVEIPDILKDKFLISEDGDTNKLLIFSTELTLKTMKNALVSSKTTFFGDGTFDVVPSPFYQLYSIHMDIESTNEHTCVVPVVYALLPDKSTETYLRVFSTLRDKFNIVINKFKCDYEKAQINAMRMVFPECEITGCFFHFQRAIWKKAKQLNLCDKMEGRKLARSTSNLPLLPKDLISAGWNDIVNSNSEKSSEIDNFEHYFVKEWLSKSLQADISCSSDRHRTNNSVEAWHSRIKKRMHGTKRNLFKFIDLLRKEAKHKDYVIKRSLFDRNKRKRSVILFNKKYTEKLHDVIEKNITPLQFLQGCIKLQKQCK